MEDENATVANQRLVHSVTVRNSQKMEDRALLGALEDQIKVEA
jgi:hypothetical protein